MTATAATFGLAAYETHMRSWGASDDTVQARRILAARFLDGRHPSEVTGTEVVEFLATPGFSAYTRRTYFCHLRSLFAWAIDAGLIEVSPMERVRRPRIPKGTPKPLTDAEVTLVLGSATGDLRAWLILSMFAGLRAHEIAKIRGEDVTERDLFVLGKGGKEAYLPTHPMVLEIAERYPSKGWWFPSKRTPLGHVEGASVTRAVGKHFKGHGIEGSVHRGRHTYATQLLRRGVNLRVVQELMRHDSISTTQLYTAVDEDERREAMMRLGAPLSVVA